MSANHEHHHHPHEHEHHDIDRSLKKRLLISILVTGFIFFAELIGGYLTNSLALMSDAAHVFMDVFALTLSWFAIYISQMPPSETRTYGLHRVEVFVSFINSFVLVLITLFIFYQAYLRLFSPEPIESIGMMAVAVIGLIVNIGVALWLSHYAASDLNIKSAFIHVLGDAAASVGVIIGAAVIYFTNWYPVDPLISILIGGIIVFGAFGIMKESSHILLEGVPKDIDYSHIMEDIKGTEGILSVHSLHIWSICHNVYALSAHLDIIPTQRWRMGEIFSEINEKLSEHHIYYTTLQAECSGCNPDDIFGKIAHKERNHHLH